MYLFSEKPHWAYSAPWTLHNIWRKPLRELIRQHTLARQNQVGEELFSISRTRPVPIGQMMGEKLSCNTVTGCPQIAADLANRATNLPLPSLKCYPFKSFVLFNLSTVCGPLWWPSAVESSHTHSVEKCHFLAAHRVAFPPSRQTFGLRLAWQSGCSSCLPQPIPRKKPLILRRSFVMQRARHSASPAPVELSCWLPTESMLVQGLWERSKIALRHQSATYADCWRLCSWEQPRKALPSLPQLRHML